MDIESVKDYLGSDWTAVQELMTGVLQSDIALLNTTNGAIMAHGGKQLRPMLSLLVSRACLRSADTYVPGQKLSPLPEVSKRYAAASELLHNATLLHDDVADGSDMRRGNPTVRSLLGPSASVLVGDFWLVRAIRLILGDSDSGCDPRVVRIFSRTLSCLAEGEMLQLQKAQTADTDYEDYLRIIYSKTASLFEAAAVTAAISVNASGVCREAVRDYAVSLGYAFQIKDDILDYCGTDSVGWVRDVPECPENRERIVSFVAENHGVDFAEKKLEGFVGKSVEAISLLAPSKEREMLAGLARFTAMRNK